MLTITVPQADGEIAISHGGDEPKRYAVNKGTVSVEESDVDGFLRQVPGSAISAGKAAGGTPTKEA